MVTHEEFQLFFDVISDIGEFVDFSKKIFIFVSHSHSDHFVKSLIQFKTGKVHYIFSEDVPTEGFKNVLTMKPGDQLKIAGLSINAYASSDLGNAYAVSFAAINVFFAGDLNWWHWENAGTAANFAEEKLFKDIVDTIDVKSFDIAFIPVDPRLGDAYSWAGEYFLERFDIRHFIPIHFGTNFAITEAFQKKNGIRGNVHCIRRLNETMML
jgi:L-ascorbate metabolism protein UlaG (beta-lactamase superfamily)